MHLVTLVRSGYRLVMIGALAIPGAAVPALAGIALATPAHAAPAVTGSLPATTTFYVNPNSSVEKWIAANPSDSREPVIASKVASQPQATWYTTYNPTAVQAQVSALTSA